MLLYYHFSLLHFLCICFHLCTPSSALLHILNVSHFKKTRMPRSRSGEANAKEALQLIQERKRAKVNNATAGDEQHPKNVLPGKNKTPPPSPGQEKTPESSTGKKTTPPASPGQNTTATASPGNRKTPPSSPMMNAHTTTSPNRKEAATEPDSDD
jgi:hypothetical protein